MKKIAVLGAGNVGAYIAANLNSDYYDVSLADNSSAALEKAPNGVFRLRADMSNPENVYNIARNYDLVVSALPEAFGYNALMAALAAGKDVVDVSFWDQTPERIAAANERAQQKHVTALIDCGIAPGFSNATLAFLDQEFFGATKTANIYVGGIPQDFQRGFYAPWSVTGLVEEYTRLALIVKDGQGLKVPALSIMESIDTTAGRLEAGVTDGLRSLVYNIDHIKNMGEFTLRYPGHFAPMVLLRGLGCFSENPLSYPITAAGLSRNLLRTVIGDKEPYERALQENGFFDDTMTYRSASPRDIAVSVLRKKWQPRPEDRDILVMRITADNGREVKTSDIYTEHNGTYSAMAVSTGGMTALGARTILEGQFNEPGVFALEQAVGRNPELMEYFVKGLQGLGVAYSQR